MRRLFSQEHELFRQTFRAFVEREVVPHQQRWREQRCVDREIYQKAGANGFLCAWLPQEYGGPGGDFLHAAIVVEELARVYETGFAASLHSDMVAPYIYSFGNEEQRQRWLPKVASGKSITAIAMTEPNAGSDLSKLQLTARRDGDHYVLNGTKTFISNGQLADLVVVAARTTSAAGQPGISLFVVEAESGGFVRGKSHHKLGMPAQDTVDLLFEDCRVSASQRLGAEGSGMFALLRSLERERLVIAIGAQATAQQVLADTVEFVKGRNAFGQPIGKFQNTQFKLAELATELAVGRMFLDTLIEEHLRGTRLVKECAMAKLHHTELLGRVTDQCLQLFGGYGYMLDYPVARAFVDARAQRIFGGTSEIMKVIIGREMGL